MGPQAAPVTAQDFAARMARLGGFEPAPRLAVGVSGGADSLALALLAQGWAAGQGGSVLALTVDHGLRPESAAETARVAAWMAARGIAHATLRWEGEKPASGIQAAARDARHRLLAERCRAEGILHLALAHHADDQAETLLLRLARGSGIDGLAGMAPVRWDPHVRVLRPLLDLPHAALVATCRAQDQEWIEDPSNRSPAYARGRLRAAADSLAAEGLTTERLTDTARRAARARRALEELTADLLGRAAALHPEGWLRLDPAALKAAPEEIGLRALSRVLACVGGAPYAPRAERLERLHAEIRAGLAAGRTLGGCRVLPRKGGLLVVREPEGATDRHTLAPGGEVWWDRRFRVRLAVAADRPLTVGRLGADGWRAACARAPVLKESPLPEPARAALPALWDGAVLVAVPTLGLGADLASAAFTPAYPLAGPAFPVVSGTTGII
ncbi:tRNA lysidine(34) synthetase TilS [Azospirillum sp.]|uniref:tRNA lysidine(34) synthetase TilS n=1 Tax=Azospirillum sp. TaxID=34012 RepID=UPI003D7195FC